jgi:hypothetical protein
VQPSTCIDNIFDLVPFEILKRNFSRHHIFGLSQKSRAKIAGQEVIAAMYQANVSLTQAAY